MEYRVILNWIVREELAVLAKIRATLLFLLDHAQARILEAGRRIRRADRSADLPAS